ncbi:hypothetical protein GCM10010502_74440 [Kitasatospora aureofaciens]|uniref:Uncharacterized protein n=1 Tax=Kitasatospora aureofaciens TaxID=1894 RepID=A0A8H9LV31_KITAU|nr:hypothetical protein GCM10010502_74440 [Kitasatospora aureofaciens]
MPTIEPLEQTAEAWSLRVGRRAWRWRRDPARRRWRARTRREGAPHTEVMLFNYQIPPYE